LSRDDRTTHQKKKKLGRRSLDLNAKWAFGKEKKGKVRSLPLTEMGEGLEEKVVYTGSGIKNKNHQDNQRIKRGIVYTNGVASLRALRMRGVVRGHSVREKGGAMIGERKKRLLEGSNDIFSALKACRKCGTEGCTQ